ncbi:MAG: PSP1 domain-containing protein [Chitinophagales bacterium]
MACSSCSTKCSTDILADGENVKGCRSNGGCTGGCNRLNVFDWLSDLPFSAQYDTCKIVEVSFKNGGRKAFFRNITNIDCYTGDMVLVEAKTGGYDIGRISLSGELVRLQMRKKMIAENTDLPRLIRIATENDLDRWEDIKEQEHNTMVLARVIARQLGLRMKIGDVAFQGDGRKATFYYTAEERVDFRELIKQYAREFRVKIEMRQIGSRQEAGLIGGIGTCGRELCCSTWLTDFKSVSTVAARYQNLAINQSKLSGQCGRLKCCLNYELDSYLDAIKAFPKNADTLMTEKGAARLVKKDIFKKKMYYVLSETNTKCALSIEQVKKIQALNQKGETIADLMAFIFAENQHNPVGFEDGVGATSLNALEEADKRKKNRERRRRRKQKLKMESEGLKPVTKETKRPKIAPKKNGETATNKKATPKNRRKTTPNRNNEVKDGRTTAKTKVRTASKPQDGTKKKPTPKAKKPLDTYKKNSKKDGNAKNSKQQQKPKNVKIEPENKRPKRPRPRRNRPTQDKPKKED